VRNTVTNPTGLKRGGSLWTYNVAGTELEKTGFGGDKSQISFWKKGEGLQTSPIKGGLGEGEKYIRNLYRKGKKGRTRNLTPRKNSNLFRRAGKDGSSNGERDELSARG